MEGKFKLFKINYQKKWNTCQIIGHILRKWGNVGFFAIIFRKRLEFFS